MGRVDGKIAMVTGAASGLGKAIAERLAGEGATVVLTDIDEKAGADVAAAIGAGATFLAHDVTSGPRWDEVMAAVERDHGRLDVMVNNAGITLMGSIEDLNYDQWRKTFDVDVDSVFWGCRAAIGLMKRTGGGSIVNMASGAGIKSSPGLCAYNAAKAAVIAATKSIALHCGEKRYGIRCNAVAPGAVRTPIIDKVLAQVADPDAMLKGFEASHPIGFIGQPSDIASIVLYLASDEARFATGAVFSVDGGMIL
ncbi:MAG: glucose 1-dehydrogenase [Alphaproteobacteria bacterium]|nr:glucose 1-dehydrogenase [Alphaproteobacteria bacterium]